VTATHGRIFRTTPAGKVSVVTEYDGEPNGLKIHKDGRNLYITESYRGCILRAR
jgi:gluconolactonase